MEQPAELAADVADGWRRRGKRSDLGEQSRVLRAIADRRHAVKPMLLCERELAALEQDLAAHTVRDMVAVVDSAARIAKSKASCWRISHSFQA